ncbi:putative quinol monooxygenase [Rhizobium leguminosarum]|uniref:putative quinol monooxygenase n=1 Tax=Rhizobium leguminosarum TaxID=384 RepID=UPI001031CC90|nr:antibiotic biosynthesis monooxygenase [Rhizobium leguminosarum]MBP2485621.1 quinol monooxygenase YgiN [Rhizobium leguminosarum]MBY5899759.1 antibiotic biosynthesis monooxygenase [Rhizobium leguminosarum]MBY5905961.1 antibiotic biosynthesis monooxygenase [Rhizobium leguminosarum]NKK89881.1 antibiotic biosynthesis monooxygenase [Rhizobium leguminosarum bv. viciae]TAU19169.1 antibiotic biosynthesis monooxygenase [Rhizobium leguminosarum]
MLILMGYIHLDPSDLHDFVTDVEAISLGTRTEEGCLFYGIVLEDGPSGRFLVAQRWQDRESLTAHLERGETLAFLETWRDRMKVDLQAYDVLEERPLAMANGRASRQ